jgi:hypothetical protein
MADSIMAEPPNSGQPYVQFRDADSVRDAEIISSECPEDNLSIAFDYPPVVENNDYPPVFDEANEMTTASIMVYGVVDLRILARKNLLRDGDPTAVEKLLTLPISSTDIVRLVAQNRTTIQHEIGEHWTELYLDAFDSIQEEDCFEMEYNVETGETSLANFKVVQVGDENSSTELVYGICVHGARKQITVAFRGCTSKKDWQVSADYSLSLHPNPVSAGVGVDDEAEAYNAYNPTNISIHHGFYNYLFRRSSMRKSHACCVGCHNSIQAIVRT